MKRSKVRTLSDFFVYSLFLFSFLFAFLVWKFDVLFVGLLVVVFFFLWSQYTDEVVITTRFILQFMACNL